jgi:diguanylate cyclase (GGDEF)-like protein
MLAALKSTNGQPRTDQIEALRMRHMDGSWRHVEVVWRNLIDEPGIDGIVLNVRDVTDRKELQEQLTYRAFHDVLTELPNRSLLVDRLTHALARCARTGRDAAVLFIDLDNFKVVNDTLGHRVGDQLLIAVAQRLRASIRPGDTVARLGGDEFIVLLEDVADASDAAEIAERCLEQLGPELLLDTQEVFVQASIGIALGGAQPSLPDDLLRQADVAMYAAKARGKNQYTLFDQSMDDIPRERLELEAELRQAIKCDELRLHYQPIVELDSGRLCGVEALVRWQHPERGLVPPDDFIPLAEETGLIVPMGRWVLFEACRQAHAWQARSVDPLPFVMSVNISARQYQDPGLVDDVACALRESGLTPATLKLEITETVAMAAGDATIETLQALKGLGVRLAIDDFGTGYSSLAYLKRFPVDTLKIDRSFVDGLGQDLQDTAIVRSVIEIARSLNLTVTAEGIETAEQLGQLMDLACNEGQGFYLARPAPAGAMRPILESLDDFPTLRAA